MEAARESRGETRSLFSRSSKKKSISRVQSRASVKKKKLLSLRKGEDVFREIGLERKRRDATKISGRTTVNRNDERAKESADPF